MAIDQSPSLTVSLLPMAANGNLAPSLRGSSLIRATSPTLSSPTSTES